MIDAHCHLYFDQYDTDRAAVHQRARNAGVLAFVSIGIDLASSRQAAQLAKSEPDTFFTVGLHPHSAHLVTDASLTEFRPLAEQDSRCVAIGECGLDYFKSEASKEVQCRVFEKMTDLAAEVSRPLVVHSRDAYRDTVRVLHRAKDRHPDLSAVFHCYSYGPEGLEPLLALGFYVSFTANLTYPKSEALRRAAKEVPSDRFMIETDAPYLAPQSKRGQRNEPAFLTELVAEIARIRRTSTDAVREQTTNNAARFFGIEAQLKKPEKP